MNTLFLDYRDPLFGIMAFLLILFVAAALSIVFAKLKEGSEAKKIKRFLQKFPANSEAGDYLKLLEAHPQSYELLSKVAHAHFDGGEYERSLSIYLAILEWICVSEKAKRAQIFENLGDIYIKSGFLGRSMEAYEQSLALAPRNESALRKIVNVYEKRGEIAKALEAVEALLELGAPEGKRKLFFEATLALRAAKSFDEKKALLLSFCELDAYFAREYLKETLFSEPQKAAEFLETNADIRFLDILWSYQLDAKSFQNTNSAFIKGVLEARGITPKYATITGVFELDVVNAARSANKELEADLNFEFVCQKCGYLDIDYFFSCKSCGHTSACVVLPKISQRSVFEKEFLESW
ncbi:MAG TPA: hypothetical protein PLV58_04725 [Campylobacterales bacterium]|nr:hypothetical protein [Campylobacterales bacterium]